MHVLYTIINPLETHTTLTLSSLTLSCHTPDLLKEQQASDVYTEQVPLRLMYEIFGIFIEHGMPGDYGSPNLLGLGAARMFVWSHHLSFSLTWRFHPNMELLQIWGVRKVAMFGDSRSCISLGAPASLPAADVILEALHLGVVWYI